MQEHVADVAVHEPVQRSTAMWILHSLGPYALLLPLAAFVSFALCLLLVLRGRNAWSGAVVCLLVPAPLLLSLFAALQGGDGVLQRACQLGHGTKAVRSG